MSDMVRTAVVAMCLAVAVVDVMVVVDVRLVAGYKVRSVVAVAAVTRVEHSPGAVVEVEIELGAYSVVVLRRRNSWSNSMASTHLPGLASVLAVRPEPVKVGKTGDVASVNRLANYKPGYRALGVGIGSIGSHMLFEDGA
jgi:hypothetical protein